MWYMGGCIIIVQMFICRNTYRSIINIIKVLEQSATDILRTHNKKMSSGLIVRDRRFMNFCKGLMNDKQFHSLIMIKLCNQQQGSEIL